MPINQPRHHSHHQLGLTLVELMIAITLGLFVILAVTGLVFASKSSYSIQTDAAIMQDTATVALSNIARSVKQAGYVNWDKEDAPFMITDEMSPNISGLDGTSLHATSAGIKDLVSSPANTNSSDVLAVRFFGSGTAFAADNTMLNCAGFGVKTPAHDKVDASRGWSIYYVANDAGGEPELRCKYSGKKSFSSTAIARGIESFQVLYGIDITGDGIANKFLSATEVDGLDSNIAAQDLKKKTNWKKVTAIKVALLLHGTEQSRTDQSNIVHYLFGKEYTGSGNDKGTEINENSLSPGRLRTVYSTTIQLRNSLN
ncbi:PilW family protein [Solimicrobium silvestre]|uniref:Prepilin-type N-terminal cleavage/methylation domain n=1 Tax=Solimicrobium silvestre TaxID=2099400 RepID=A0A2S9H4Y4_9BURK|nr:PilW family protein [Solimicrobium silvestre]PRC95050.1 hypothetical protein S2091_0245 [Solimicrobium silvestre]